MQNLKVYKNKERKGQLERLVDEHTIIAKVSDALFFYLDCLVMLTLLL